MSIFVGGTNYSNKPFSNLVKDLRGAILHSQKSTKVLQINLRRWEGVHKKGELPDSPPHSPLSHDFRISLNRSIELLKSATELKDIIPSVRNKEVEGWHIKRLRDIGAEARDLSKNLGIIFHKYEEASPRWEKLSRVQKDFLNLEIYGLARNSINVLVDFLNMAHELEKYEGRRKNIEIAKVSHVNVSVFNRKIDPPEEKTKKTPKKAKKKTTVLVLERNGDLWREPREKYCYSMKEGSKRHRIMQALSSGDGYVKTENLATAVGYASTTAARTEIGKIRKNIKSKLKLNGQKVIGSDSGSGYRIGEGFKIKKVP